MYESFRLTYPKNSDTWTQYHTYVKRCTNKYEYSKTCVKRPLKNSQLGNKYLISNGSLMKVESIAECLEAFCNTFDLH